MKLNSRNNSRRRRRGSNSLTILVVLLIAAGIFLLLSTTILFNTEYIRISGESNYSAQEILDASGIKAGDNLVRLSTDKCADRITSKLVYIENARVSRSFPSTMVINVEPCIPAANFYNGNDVILVSGGGKVLEKNTEARAGLLNFKGTDPDPALLPGDAFKSEDEHKDDVIKTLMELFGNDSQLGENVTLVDITDRSEISYTYDGRIVVKLGSLSDIEYKIKFSREVINTKIGEKTEGVLTILSDSKGATFLDKESLEHNAQVYNENMETRVSEIEENVEEESSEETSKIDPIME